VKTTEGLQGEGLLGLLVEGVGQVKDAARQFALCCFILFYLHSVGVGNNLISAASLLVTSRQDFCQPSALRHV
jgi:hypothetical protein